MSPRLTRERFTELVTTLAAAWLAGERLGTIRELTSRAVPVNAALVAGVCARLVHLKHAEEVHRLARALAREAVDS